MARTHKTKTVTQTRTYLDTWTCDICGASIKGDTYASYTPPNYSEGEEYPEFGEKTVRQFDLCPKHAAEVWTHIAEKYGIEPREEVIEW